jgi:hypothetical protein
MERNYTDIIMGNRSNKTSPAQISTPREEYAMEPIYTMRECRQCGCVI